MTAKLPGGGASPVDPGIVKRRKKILRDALTVLLVGLLYACFVRVTGWGIPCPIHYFTGLQCPGCGMTRMCMALLRLDFRAAFAANPAILCMLPLMAVNAAQLTWLFVHRAKSNSVPTDTINWFIIGVLVVFGVVRNLP